jgi:hypothetical protein
MLSGGCGGCADYKAAFVFLGFAFCFQYADAAFSIVPLSVQKAQVMPIGGKGGAGFRHARQSKPLPNRYPVRNGGNIDAGGKGDPGGNGVVFGIGKG